MNTLTINISDLEINTSLENTLVTDIESTPAGTYEIIENEIISTNDFKDLILSGSLFSLTTFKNVTFESCTFFGSKIENCTFINCNFTDCKFEFTTMSHCKFNGCNFDGLLWDHTPVTKSTFAYSRLDANTAFFINEDENHLISCEQPQDLTWEQALESELPPPVPQVNCEEVIQLPIKWITEALSRTSKKAA